MWVVKKLKKNLHKKLKGNKRSQDNKILLQEKENEKAERENKFVSETNLRDLKKKKHPRSRSKQENIYERQRNLDLYSESPDFQEPAPSGSITQNENFEIQIQKKPKISIFERQRMTERELREAGKVEKGGKSK